MADGKRDRDGEDGGGDDGDVGPARPVSDDDAQDDDDVGPPRPPEDGDEERAAGVGPAKLAKAKKRKVWRGVPRLLPSLLLAAWNACTLPDTAGQCTSSCRMDCVHACTAWDDPLMYGVQRGAAGCRGAQPPPSPCRIHAAS